jgi:peptide deformylase
MAIRKVIQAGHASLKKNNKIITSFKSPKVKKLIKDLKNTMYKTGLIGIAAPQINENYMIFVTHPRTTKSRKQGKKDTFRVYINPKITHFSGNESIIYEGCGSVADGAIFGPVKRSKELTIEAFDENGVKFKLICDGILARVIFHEMDHLKGIEFIQKVDDYSKIVVESFYRKNIKNSSEQLQASKTTKIEYKK